MGVEVVPVRGGVAIAPAVEMLKALAHPLRLAVVVALDERPRCVHELVDQLGEVQPLVSRHLGVLREAGLVTGTRRGREVVYALADEHVAHIAKDTLLHAQEGRA
jgi:ArsR family transcriptional regulator, zinc-responsive transcriptional repressor